MSEDVSLNAIGSGVFEILLQRPERMNALGVATCAALKQAVADAAQQRARVVLLRGSGRAFCAGADLKERKGMDLAARLAHNGCDPRCHRRCRECAVRHDRRSERRRARRRARARARLRPSVCRGRRHARPHGEPGGRLSRSGRHAAPAALDRREPCAADDAHRRTRDQRIRAWASDSSTKWCRPRSWKRAPLSSQRCWQADRPPRSRRSSGSSTKASSCPWLRRLQVERAALPEILGSADYAEGLAAFAERRAPRFTEVVQ